MRPLVHLARIELNEIKQLSIFTDVTLRFIDHTLAGIEAIVGSLGRNRLRETISRIDTKFIRRVLQRSPQTPDDKVVKIYEQIALKLHLAAVNPEASAEYLHDLPSSLVKKYFQEEIRANLEVLESKDEEAPFGATTALPPKKKEPRKQQSRRISRTSAQLRRNPEWIRPVGMISDHDPLGPRDFPKDFQSHNARAEMYS